jgi:hypothetical protein
MEALAILVTVLETVSLDILEVAMCATLLLNIEKNLVEPLVLGYKVVNFVSELLKCLFTSLHFLNVVLWIHIPCLNSSKLFLQKGIFILKIGHHVLGQLNLLLHHFNATVVLQVGVVVIHLGLTLAF